MGKVASSGTVSNINQESLPTPQEVSSEQKESSSDQKKEKTNPQIPNKEKSAEIMLQANADEKNSPQTPQIQMDKLHIPITAQKPKQKIVLGDS
ncbi:MAG: hypothetical protein GXP45_00220 [bacterium]|nr:hypothetical protein [bacterium]